MYWMIIHTRHTSIEDSLDPLLEIVSLEEVNEDTLRELLDEHERNDMHCTAVPFSRILGVISDVYP